MSANESRAPVLVVGGGIGWSIGLVDDDRLGIVVRLDVPTLARPARGLIGIRLGLEVHHRSELPGLRPVGPMVVWRQGRAEAGRIAGYQHLGQQRERLVGAGSVAHHDVIQAVVVVPEQRRGRPCVAAWHGQGSWDFQPVADLRLSDR